jgi:hypothetical protein
LARQREAQRPQCQDCGSAFTDKRWNPRKAAPWFTAMVHFNPMDNVGARFFAPGGPGEIPPYTL